MVPSVMNCWPAKGVTAQVPLAVELIRLPLVDGIRLLPQDATTSVACGDDTALIPISLAEFQAQGLRSQTRVHTGRM